MCCRNSSKEERSNHARLAKAKGFVEPGSRYLLKWLQVRAFGVHQWVNEKGKSQAMNQTLREVQRWENNHVMQPRCFPTDNRFQGLASYLLGTLVTRTFVHLPNQPIT